jgi:hypothetical protein
MTSPIHLILPDRCLAAFVDDTGHEALVKGHPVYGLGGCAVMGRDIERNIVRPWKEIRKRVKGSPEIPLHAHNFSRIAKPEDIKAIEQFFCLQRFWRFGAIITVETNLAHELSLMQTMKLVLQQRINEIAWTTLCKEVKLIFESSDRADRLVQDAFQDFEVYRGPKHIPSECYFMQKSRAEPALEVADFVMHAVGRQARHNLKQRGSFVPDFRAVFHSVDRKFTSFMEVAMVTKNDAAAPATPSHLARG